MRRRSAQLKTLSGLGLLGASVLLTGCAGHNHMAQQPSGVEVEAPVALLSEAEQGESLSPSPEAVPAEKGADAAAANFAQRLALAARYGEMAAINYLLDNGAAIDGQDAYGNTALIAAAGNGQAEVVKLLLERGAKLDLTNDEGLTALMNAAARGDYELAHTLIQAGAGVDIRNNQGETALFLATQYGHLSAVKVLFNAAANPNLQNSVPASKSNSGYTPLMYAATHGLTRDAVDWAAMAKLLLDNGADPNLNNTHGESALVFANKRGDRTIAALLKEAGAKDDTAYVGLSPDAALIKAARLGDSYKARLLLANGAKVNAIDHNGVTPLLAAAHEGRLELVRLLAEAGAEINFVPLGLREFALSRSSAPMSERELMMVAARGDTALIAAGRAGHADVVEALLAKGASLDVANRQGELVLFIAAAQGDLALVKRLLDRGASANSLEVERRGSNLASARSALGRDSVLIRAAQQGHLEVVRLLLERGAEIDHRGFMGKSALYAAVENGRIGVAELLLARGATVAQGSLSGVTPLMEAARSGNQRLIQALLERGADVNAIERPEFGYVSDSNSGSGMTALMFAARAGHQAAVERLLRAGAQRTITNANGKRAIDEARDNGFEAVVQLLSGAAVTSASAAQPEAGAADEGVTVRKYEGR